ncbi:MAG: hypothetical protein QQN55_07460 [Nitrosopumilus sp.]
MKITVIETKRIRHTVEVGNTWPTECLDDLDKAKDHLQSAMDSIGIEPITRESEVLINELVIED